MAKAAPQAADAYVNAGSQFDPPEYPEQEYTEYADPTGDAPYTDTFGWAPALRLDVDTIPDTRRLGTAPRYDFSPDPVRPPEEFYGRRDANTKSRESVTEQQATGWQETKSGFGQPDPSAGAMRFAPNPRSIPPAESRITQLLSPANYSFVRPFMQGLPKMGARDLNGVHFSMADHRRNYEILGMAPQRKPGSGSRNTYRLEPQPWDTGIVDMPPTNMDQPETVEMPTVDVAYQSRSWRL